MDSGAKIALFSLQTKLSRIQKGHLDKITKVKRHKMNVKNLIDN